MKHLSFYFRAGFIALAAIATVAMATPFSAADARDMVVIELFTSQGCSSCPPADAVLEQMAARKDVIALSLPVDYWDYLGWKDTLALHGHTERQYAYAKAQGESMVYTPQMVLNGALALTGNDAETVNEAIAHVRKNAPLSGEAAITQENGRLEIALEGLPPGRHTAWLVPLGARKDVTIGRGENAGRSITYVNVPLTWIKLGEAEGGDKSFSHAADDEALRAADGCAVLVQSASKNGKGNGPLVAAARLSF